MEEGRKRGESLTKRPEEAFVSRRRRCGDSAELSVQEDDDNDEPYCGRAAFMTMINSDEPTKRRG